MGAIILFIILILILVDVFLAYEIPTHLAYISATLLIVIMLDHNIIYQVFIGVLLWVGFLVFHYLIWRKFIERIHDKIISPQKHKGGIEGLIGKKGVITEINGYKFICINAELYEFTNETNQEIMVGRYYLILRTVSNRLII